MQETPKNEPDTERANTDEREKSSWAEDQKKREYYYDDAHGYEVYEPDEVDVEAERMQKQK